VILVVLGAAAPAASASSAVVLVSGFTTSTPFTTPDPSCNGSEGDTWSPSVAPVLKGAGFTVFTAPQGPNADGSAPGNAPAPCLGPGQAAPPASDTINTGGDVDQNGERLGQFLAFLHQSYGVTSVQLVGHSDGGIWSRSAITQPANFPRVTVASLTTLGSPHEGSFAADLALGVDGLDCAAPSNLILRILCGAVQDVTELIEQELGPTALHELTSTFMGTWNTTQTIGACPTTVIAGTYVQVPLIGSLLPLYYSPSDGVVGQSSAMATASTGLNLQPIAAPDLPGLTDGGTFPVVHSQGLSFITPDTLLNQAGISAVVKNAVAAGGNGTACAQGPPQSPPVASAASRPPPPAPAKLTLDPISVAGNADAAKLPPTRLGDIVVGRRGVRVSCGQHVVVDRASPGFHRVVFAPVPACARGLEVAGGRAVELRRDRKHPVDVRVQGSRVRFHVRRGPVRRLEAQVSTGGAYRPLPLDRRGRGRLPPDNNGTRLRVLLTVGRAPAPRETAVAVLAR
jgi:triacylglycerol lipase